MKRFIIHTIILLGAITVPFGPARAEMKSYCSAPPFVTRTVTPNIMILMDNSQDMLASAYEATYNPTATKIITSAISTRRDAMPTARMCLSRSLRPSTRRWAERSTG